MAPTGAGALFNTASGAVRLSISSQSTHSRPASPTAEIPSLGWNYSSAAFAQEKAKLALREASWPSLLVGSLHFPWSGQIPPMSTQSSKLLLLLQVQWLPYPQWDAPGVGRGAGTCWPFPKQDPHEDSHWGPKESERFNVLSHISIKTCFVIIANWSQ